MSSTNLLGPKKEGIKKTKKTTKNVIKNAMENGMEKATMEVDESKRRSTRVSKPAKDIYIPEPLSNIKNKEVYPKEYINKLIKENSIEEIKKFNIDKLNKLFVSLEEHISKMNETVKKCEEIQEVKKMLNDFKIFKTKILLKDNIDIEEANTKKKEKIEEEFLKRFEKLNTNVSPVGGKKQKKNGGDNTSKRVNKITEDKAKK
jgi:hypothetical protein